MNPIYFLGFVPFFTLLFALIYLIEGNLIDTIKFIGLMVGLSLLCTIALFAIAWGINGLSGGTH